MRGEVRKLKRAVRRGRIVMPAGVTLHRLPRQLCKVCTKVWDFAMVPDGTLPTPCLCSECKGYLAEGYTIFVCAGKTPIRGKNAILKQDGVAGRIVRVCEEDYEKLQIKQHDNDRIRQLRNNANSPAFDLTGMKLGDSFLGCAKCKFQLPPGVAAKPVCSDCNGVMRIYTVTEFDVIPKTESD